MADFKPGGSAETSSGSFKPVRTSRSHQELHKELLLAHRKGLVLSSKLELQRVLERRRREQSEREEQQQSRTPLEEVLLRRQRKQQEQERQQEEQVREEAQLLEFVRVRQNLRKIQNKSSKSSNEEYTEKK
ncbi:actin-associated protein FAM107A [Lampris incognitus]|uniref:actin-associated protein FAM107A n=1 Tax=Lampris incognitus TaxID=2546036 RepID=UPI0024B4C763|nr:actin-associated protein FAM107A [Lampris incognitus]